MRNEKVCEEVKEIVDYILEKSKQWDDIILRKMKVGIFYIGNTYCERYMPNGQKVIEGKGIPPDIECNSENAYNLALSLIEKTNK